MQQVVFQDGPPDPKVVFQDDPPQPKNCFFKIGDQGRWDRGPGTTDRDQGPGPGIGTRDRDQGPGPKLFHLDECVAPHKACAGHANRTVFCRHQIPHKEPARHFPHSVGHPQDTTQDIAKAQYCRRVLGNHTSMKQYGWSRGPKSLPQGFRDRMKRIHAQT